MSIPENVESLRTSFASGKTRNVIFREKQLKALLRLIDENRNEILEALAKDLRKNTTEAEVYEIEFVYNDIKMTLDKLRNWMKPESQPKTVVNVMDNVFLHSEPYGVVLIIGPWNYPINLTLMPLTGAIAAGNCVLLKPSEVASACSKFLFETFPKYLDNDCYKVIEGGVEQTSAILQEKFDYIFYTGSTTVGKIIYASAAKHLTPVTLELGGKSPVYLDNTADLKTAAKRILWGKFLNSGQTCVAPDYILCTEEIQAKFLEVAKEILFSFYGENAKLSLDYGRIINDHHFARLFNLMSNQEIAIGGSYDKSEKYIEPTILANIKQDSPIMQEEIFGPILPIVPIHNAFEAMEFVNSREKPLAFYVFSNSKKDIEFFLNTTSSGAIVVNDTIMHLCTLMPFGGVGASGLGRYHGKSTFDTFSNKKSVLQKDLGLIGEMLSSVRYPPFNEKKLKLLKKAVAYRGTLLSRGLIFSHGSIFIVGIVLAVLYKHFFP